MPPVEQVGVSEPEYTSMHSLSTVVANVTVPEHDVAVHDVSMETQLGDSAGQATVSGGQQALWPSAAMYVAAHDLHAVPAVEYFCVEHSVQESVPPLLLRPAAQSVQEGAIAGEYLYMGHDEQTVAPAAAYIPGNQKKKLKKTTILLLVREWRDYNI